MKKNRTIVIIGAMMMLCACKKEEEIVVTETVTEVITETETVTEEVTEEETTISDEVRKEMEIEVNELFFHNSYCYMMVFGLDSLPTVEIPDENSSEYLYQVDTSMFRDYADFEEYLRSVFVEETVDKLLKFPNEGQPKYVNKDGDLYLDIRLAEGKEDYVDWYNYTLNIDYVDDKECGFTITAIKTIPSENPTEEEYSVSGKIIWDDGKWYLEDMLY